MSIIYLLISLFLGTFLVHWISYLAVIKYDDVKVVASCFWISLITAPLSILSTAMFTYFYGKGVDELSYPVLVTSAIGFSLLASFIVHHFILETKPVSFVEMIGLTLIVAGILLINFQEKLFS